MTKINGFTMFEVIIASSIFFSAMVIFIPIFNQIQIEQSILEDRRVIIDLLHEELQKYIWEESSQLPAEDKRKVNHTTVHLQFSMDDQFIKGCVEWNDAKQKKESFCLYGSPKNEERVYFHYDNDYDLHSGFHTALSILRHTNGKTSL